MLSTATTLALVLLPLTISADQVLSVYTFHRHGDRTDKSHAPASLTDLGYTQVYNSGQYYRSRYVHGESMLNVYNLNPDLVLQSQIQASAPADNVIQNSAMAFLQGLYPPVGPTTGAQTLANGTSISAPMNGYQLIPIGLVTSGSGSEDESWLQDATQCSNAEQSSNQYYYTPQYNNLLSSTNGFYQNLLPLIGGTFNTTRATFKNAYTIFDLINVNTVHNATFLNSPILTNDTRVQLQSLANTHEYNLAYNASSPIRGIAGMILAGQALSFLNNSILAQGSKAGPKYGVQFGAYATMLSFFGLSNLTSVDEMFYGIPGYASAMTLELYTNVSWTGMFPPTSDLRVRFLWHNGTNGSGDDLTPVAYPLFGTGATSLPWTDFYSHMSNISVITNTDWCVACGNTTGTCAGVSASSSGSLSPAASAAAKSASHGGISNAVAGVIGAMVTLAVILGLEVVLLGFGGFRLSKKGSDDFSDFALK